MATATFIDGTQILTVQSEIAIQQYDELPHNFLGADYAVDCPFYYYNDEDKALLSPYMSPPGMRRPTCWQTGLMLFGGLVR